MYAPFGEYLAVIRSYCLASSLHFCIGQEYLAANLGCRDESFGACECH